MGEWRDRITFERYYAATVFGKRRARSHFADSRVRPPLLS
jgi:hypothetical protein